VTGGADAAGTAESYPAERVERGALARALAEVCGASHVGPATAADAVPGLLGPPTALLARPASAAEVAGVLRAASAHGAAVLARGAGTMLGRLAAAGRPDRAWGSAVVCDVSRLTQVAEHSAGDLIVRVGAGATLGDLDERVAAAGQRLALDPPESPAATVGGVIAAAASGPLRHRYGTARDLLLGVTVALADGTLATSGGTVVKNVAGYDLGKLYTGSFGTLGVIVDAVLRLHPRPPERRWVVLPAASPGRVADLAAHLGDSQLVPSAVEYDSGPAGTGGGAIAVLFEGRPAGVAAQSEALARVDPRARLAASPPRWWGRHPWSPAREEAGAAHEAAGAAHEAPHGAAPGGDGSLGLAVSFPPGRLAGVLARLGEVDGARVRGRVVLGALEVAVPALDAAWLERLRDELGQWGGGAVVTAGRMSGVDVWGYRGDALPLMRRVKEQFDPSGVLAPGVFVGGI
jgi:glycolate oxidase FAD binding subunit